MIIKSIDSSALLADLSAELDTGDTTAETTSTAVDVEKVKADIKTSLDEISGVLAQKDEYLANGVMTEDDVTKAETLQKFLTAELATLEGSDVPEVAEAAEEEVDPTAGMTFGWNGAASARQDTADATKYGANYRGTVYIQNSGAYSAADPLASSQSVLLLDADVREVYGRTEGKDAIIEVVHADGKRDIWKIKDLTSRTADLLAIDGSRATAGIKFDMSGLIRVSNGKLGPAFGKLGGLVINGSKFDDIINGTEGNDVISGNDGNDIIRSLGGTDSINGGAGDDLIDGGVGVDYKLTGGDGYDTVVSSAVESDGEVSHMETFVDEKLEKLTNGSWLSMSGYTGETKNGEFVISASGADVAEKKISITLPEDYTMCYAQTASDGGSTILTMFNPETGKTARVRLYIDDETSLTITGNGKDNIIDLHAAYINANITLRGGAGNDVLVAPDTDIVNIDNRKPTASNVGKNNLEVIDEAFTFLTEKIAKANEGKDTDDLTDEDLGFTHKIENNQIVITPTDKPAAGASVTINGPKDLGYGYYTTWKSGDDQMVAFFKETESGDVKKVVVKLVGCAGANLTVTCSATLIPNTSVNVIDGGAGVDLMYGLAATTTTDTDQIFKGEYNSSATKVEETADDEADDESDTGVLEE